MTMTVYMCIILCDYASYGHGPFCTEVFSIFCCRMRSLTGVDPPLTSSLGRRMLTDLTIWDGKLTKGQTLRK